MHSRRHGLRSLRGFTLVELMIVISIVAVLCALGMVGYQRYIHQAQTSEAKMVLGQIRSGEEQYRAETLTYLSCSSSLTDFYPNASPDDSRWVWLRSTDSRYNDPNHGWAMLNVNPDAPVRFGYAVVAGVSPGSFPSPDPSFKTPPAWPTGLAPQTPWFVASAKNVHVSSMKPSVAMTTSYDGTVYSENDGE